MRRWISLAVTVAMILPVAASVAEGAMATWLSPQPGQIVSGGRVEVAVGYNTGSNLKVTAVEMYVDGQYYARKVLRTPEVRGVCSFSWDTTRVEQGTHNLVVKVYSGDQVISKVYGTGTVGPNGVGGGTLDVRPPVVTFANIKAGDVIKGTKTVIMNAVDDSGKSPMVSLLIDENLKLLKNTPPYTYDLDSTTYTNGDHSLKTFAYDSAGNRSDPAVIKVEFRNGDSSPAVTTLAVVPELAPEPAPAKITKATPPAVAADSAPSIRSSAARAVPHLSANTSAAPVVAVVAPKPEPRVASVAKSEPKAAVSQPVKLSAPALSTSAVKMASATESANLRNAELQPSVQSYTSADKPGVVEAPSASGVRHSSATRLPEARATLMSAPELAKESQPAAPSMVSVKKPVVMATAKAAEPKHIALPPAAKPAVRVAAARKSEAVKMSSASQLPATHKVARNVASSAAVADAPRIVGEPVSSSVKNVPIDQVAKVKSSPIGSASASKAVAAAPSIPKSVLKQVRVAMAPDFRTAAKGVSGMSAITQPPVVVQPAKARIEKTSIPAKGKVKARSFFNDLGGVLFWDPSTHTVTACVKGMVIEMQVGSRLATVNGHQFTMDTAPYIINGRTFFEAKTYSQACSLLDGLRTVGKAELN